MKISALNAILFLLISVLLLACSNSDEDPAICDGSLDIEILDQKDAVDGQDIGSIEMDASGGVAPYLYSIDGINFTESKVFSNLKSGPYTVIVKDQNDCTVEMRVDVKLQAIVSFSNNILPILQTNCMISGCHCDGNSLCFDTYENVKANARGIKDRTAARSMPPATSGKVLTEAEITSISNWVYQGMNDN